MPLDYKIYEEVRVEYLMKIDYWMQRFEETGDIEHLDRAERFADVVRLYLPSHLQELSLTSLLNLYRSLSIKQASTDL